MSEWWFEDPAAPVSAAVTPLVFYSTDPVTDSTPTWVQVAAADLYGYDIRRGRSAARGDMDAGTATITLNNRSRTYDPFAVAALQPMNRWKIQLTHNGVTYDRFLGYADSYTCTWPNTGTDSVTVVSCTDELKPLNLVRTASMDPVTAADYTAVVGADSPDFYAQWLDELLMETTIVDEYEDLETIHWDAAENGGYGGFSFDQRLVNRTVTVEGQGWKQGSYTGFGFNSDSPILGFETSAAEGGAPSRYGSLYLSGASQGLQASDASTGDMRANTRGSVELWFKKAGNPISNTGFWLSPEVSGVAARLWSWALNTTGTVEFTVRVSGGSTQTVTSAVLSNNTWYHLVAARNGSNLILYVNGTLYTSVSSTLAWETASTTVPMAVQRPGATVQMAHQAVYVGRELTAGRVLAHFSAGTGRGFTNQMPGVRVDSILTSVGNVAARSIQTGTREMTAGFLSGLPAATHIQAAVQCEAPDGMFFAARDGTLTFLAASHRSSGPYGTPMAIFDDDNTDLSYLDAAADTSDDFLANTWNVAKARWDSLVQTATDATSIGKYFEREQSITDLPLRLNADALTIAQAYLAKYKDPFDRIPEIQPNMTVGTVVATVLDLDLGYNILMVRRPLGGGLISQSGWIQSISESYNQAQPLTIDVRLGVSPR